MMIFEAHKYIFLEAINPPQKIVMFFFVIVYMLVKTSQNIFVGNPYVSNNDRLLAKNWIWPKSSPQLHIFVCERNVEEVGQKVIFLFL